MTESTRPTIFALSSGRGPAAIAVVRVSGPRAGEALKALGVKTIKPREAKFARLRNPQTNEIIDEAIVLWFPGPRSETGEDMVELQLHGGRAVVAATLAALGKVEGLRPAEAGEFTRRAFENGKLDLTAVEGLADLVMAETEGQRRQALRQMQGALGRQAESWRERLVKALALVEAGIDFSDEADVPEELLGPALAIVRDLEREISSALADGRRGERLREGLVVAIAGPPNAGKSTLLNRIARREAAIVSPYAGTTRDVIEVHLDLGGLPITLLDTAGIRETDDPVELEGVRRARERAASADLVLWVEDATTVSSSSVGSSAEGDSDGGWTTSPLLVLAQRPQNESVVMEAGPADMKGPITPIDQPPPVFGPLPTGPVVWRIRNKIDLLDQSGIKTEPQNSSFKKNEPISTSFKSLKSGVKRPSEGSAISPPLRNEYKFIKYELEFNICAISGTGFNALLAALAETAERFLAGAESALIARVRHRRALEETLVALRRVSAEPLAEHEDLLAEELRAAATALGRLTGRVDVEDILDVIFRDFCIGK